MKHYISIGLKLLLSLSLLIITQIGFYIFNSSLFEIESLYEWYRIIYGGMKFAIASTLVYLTPFLFLTLIPFRFRMNRYYKVVYKVLYIIGTQLMLIINIIDIGYYRFSFRRMRSDFFNFLGVGGDFSELIPQFARDYWHLFLLFILLNLGFVYILKRIDKKYSNQYFFRTRKAYALSSIVFILATSSTYLGIRGGFQYRPLSLIQANHYAHSQNTALVLNSPYTLYRTIGKSGIEPITYFQDPEEMAQHFSPIINNEIGIEDSLFSPKLELGKTNILLIILESFSAEYMGFYRKDGISYTPFLDSLAQHSICFDAYSNGRRSIDALPAILSSLPLLMEETYITSAYGGNSISSFANLLEPYGYSNIFFHGGYNGTMGFDAFAKNAGYREYFGKDEYNNDKDYDGNWGIFDEPFLQRMIKELDNLSQPFNATVFTLSSHHPYTIPKEHIGKFPKGSLLIHETIGYADYAIRRFMEEARNKPWFENSLFVFTADHSSQNELEEFRNLLGSYRIPVIFYSPSLQKPYYDQTSLMQQIDILPTTLSLLNYPKEYIGFGQNIFSDQEKYYMLYFNQELILVCGNYLSRYREGEEIELFHLPSDPNAKSNIAEKRRDIAKKHELKTKAIIQEHNTRMMENKLIP